MRLHIVHPIDLSVFRIKAVHKSRKITNKNQTTVGVDRNRRDRTMDPFIIPQEAALGDVARLRRIQANQVSHPFTVFGILAGGDINAVFVEHRRCVYFARTFGRRITDRLAVPHLILRRVAIGLPNGLQHAGVFALHRLRIERVAPAVAAAEKDQGLAIHFCGRR